jgi:hypothetical protein
MYSKLILIDDNIDNIFTIKVDKYVGPKNIIYSASIIKDKEIITVINTLDDDVEKLDADAVLFCQQYNKSFPAKVVEALENLGYNKEENV